MSDVRLFSYSVIGIKNLERLASIKFYEAGIDEINVIGVCDANGCGKSGVFISVEILRNILTDSRYLNNSAVQQKLDAVVNKQLKELNIEVEFIATVNRVKQIFRYGITLSKDENGMYTISSEEFLARKASSKDYSMQEIFKVSDGKLLFFNGEKEMDDLASGIFTKTLNLLPKASLSSLFYTKFLCSENKYSEEKHPLFKLIKTLYTFGINLFACLRQSDGYGSGSIHGLDEKIPADLNRDCLLFEDVTSTTNVVPLKYYKHFQETVNKLCEFIQTFKSDLRRIDVKKKVCGDVYICDLEMVYEDYSIALEYESSGIKKLVSLFPYLVKVSQGGIVFIDDFDSDLHEVCFSRLLEYLVEHGKGQVCFTTHNVEVVAALIEDKGSTDHLSMVNIDHLGITEEYYSPNRLCRCRKAEECSFSSDANDFMHVFS